MILPATLGLVYVQRDVYRNKTNVFGTLSSEPTTKATKVTTRYGTSALQPRRQKPAVALPSTMHRQSEKVCHRSKSVLSNTLLTSSSLSIIQLLHILCLNDLSVVKCVCLCCVYMICLWFNVFAYVTKWMLLHIGTCRGYHQGFYSFKIVKL